MFKIKKPAIITLLIVLLVFTGYLNNQLTQQAQIKSAREYQKHELSQIEQSKDELDMVEGTNVKDEFEAVVEVNELDVIESAKQDENSALETMYVEANKANKNYFIEYRLSRDKLRASLVERLDSIVNNINTSETMRNDAQKQIMDLGKNSETELQIEGLIKAKGYADAIVFLTEEDIKIVISADELAEQDMIKILDIVKSETDYTANNIKIMKKQ